MQQKERKDEHVSACLFASINKHGAWRKLKSRGLINFLFSNFIYKIKTYSIDNEYVTKKNHHSSHKALSLFA